MATAKQIAAAKRNIKKAQAKLFGRKITKRKAAKMAKNGGNFKRKAKFTLPLAVVAGFVPITLKGVDLVKSGGFGNLKYLTKRLIPWDSDANGGKGAFSAKYLGEGLFPILGGIAFHMIANKIGINRLLSRAGIPFIRI